MTLQIETDLDRYKAELVAWHTELENSLRSDTGWLTVAGLHWLHEGENSVGSNPLCEVTLPVGSTPEQIGTLTLKDGEVTLLITTEETVTVDDQTVTTAILRNDYDAKGASMVRSRGVTFFVIKRADQYAIRVRDINNPARQAFTGRRWFPANPALRTVGRFHRYAETRQMNITHSTGMDAPMDVLGWVEFTLDGTPLRLEALDGGKDKLWFIFKDATNGKATYGAGRFMYSKLLPDDQVELDFNRAYSPPCSFTPYATCPLPPKENILTVAIEAGEMKHDG